VIESKCPYCRAVFDQKDCKGVVAHLSNLDSPVFFTAESPEKKRAIEVIGWAMKRRLVARI
jgi:predicted dithiol-disulfide oxidoreductase (DUF899 family)